MRAGAIGGDGKLEWASKKGSWGEGFNAVGPTRGEPALGQWYDAESGLHYNFFRYFDPEIGRFLSPDPIDLLGGINVYLQTTDPYWQYDRYSTVSSRSRWVGASVLARPAIPSSSRSARPTTAWQPFGPGWRPTWFAELRLVLDGFIYTRADGTELSYLGYGFRGVV